LAQEFDVVCLGGGVAGEAIAAGLQDSGLTLAVVERELVGGECPYWGCVPSKTLLRSSETLTEAERARLLAASCVEWTVDFPKVSTRVLRMARNLDDSRPAASMEATGARLFRGEGKLTDLHTDPETASVGLSEAAARSGGINVVVASADPAVTARGHIHDFRGGAYSDEPWKSSPQRRSCTRRTILMKFTTTDGGHDEQHTDSQ
jgi:pyruvate/2-oxoglutarate dehydrogenase complex dihydrolipoamide dehydrogenase (E3) component